MKKQIKQSDLKKIRDFYYKKQKGICPILKIKVPFSETVVDHCHGANGRNLGNPEESGLIRGVIHRSSNVIEGKISNSYIRTGLHKTNVTLPEFLRNLADFLENPPLIHLKLIHPSEKPKEKRLGKSSYNKLQKAFVKKYPKKKFPDFPKSKKMTKGLRVLFDEMNIKPNFVK